MAIENMQLRSRREIHKEGFEARSPCAAMTHEVEKLTSVGELHFHVMCKWKLPASRRFACSAPLVM
jgi:hypothetical protein